MPGSRTSRNSGGNGHRARETPRAQPNRTNIDTGEIFQALAAGVLEYSRQKYLTKQSSTLSSQSRRASRRSKNDNTTKERGPVTRSGSSASRSRGGDATAAVMGLVMGLGAPLVKGMMERRRTNRERAKEVEEDQAAQQRAFGRRRSRKEGRGMGDVDLDAGLRALSREAEEVSGSIRRLAGRKPSHANCEVHASLVQNAERVRESLGNLQTSAVNVRNLGGDQVRRRGPEVRVGARGGGDGSRSVDGRERRRRVAEYDADLDRERRVYAARSSRGVYSGDNRLRRERR